MVPKPCLRSLDPLRVPSRLLHHFEVLLGRSFDGLVNGWWHKSGSEARPTAQPWPPLKRAPASGDERNIGFVADALAHEKFAVWVCRGE